MGHPKGLVLEIVKIICSMCSFVNLRYLNACLVASQSTCDHLFFCLYMQILWKKTQPAFAAFINDRKKRHLIEFSDV